MKTRRLASLALVLGVGLAGAPASAAISLTLSPASSHVNIGDSTQVEVFISGLDAQVLSAFDLNFRWNAAIAQWTAVDFSDAETALGAPHAMVVHDTLTQGDYGLQGFSMQSDADLAAAQANSFRLGVFTFQGLADGATTLSLGLDPDFERNLVGLNALSLSASFGQACIAVGAGQCGVVPIPEPSTYALMALGLAALGLAARRRRG